MHGSPSNKANCQMHLWPTCCFNECLTALHHLQQIVHVLEISFGATFGKGGQRRGRLDVHRQRCKTLSTNGSHGSPFTGARETTSTYRALWVVHAIASSHSLLCLKTCVSCLHVACCVQHQRPLWFPTHKAIWTLVLNWTTLLQLRLSSEGAKVLQACSKRKRFNDDDFTSEGTADCHKMVAHLEKDRGWFWKSRLISRTYLDLGLFVP